mmetsp:Transcript_24358/g.78736  ORF Transcript_24358/g.78736 Transcript_24358/m.78736 type:complete len:214 (-) Transcript_24358:230-871(-)
MFSSPAVFGTNVKDIEFSITLTGEVFPGTCRQKYPIYPPDRGRSELSGASDFPNLYLYSNLDVFVKSPDSAASRVIPQTPLTTPAATRPTSVGEGVDGARMGVSDLMLPSVVPVRGKACVEFSSCDMRESRLVSEMEAGSTIFEFPVDIFRRHMFRSFGSSDAMSDVTVPAECSGWLLSSLCSVVSLHFLPYSFISQGISTGASLWITTSPLA